MFPLTTLYTERWFPPTLFETAEALFDALAPTREFWESYSGWAPPHILPPHSAPQAWLFRGHADARWNLVPSSVRGLTTAKGRTSRELDARERGVLEKFYRYCRKAGLRLPPTAVESFDLLESLVDMRKFLPPNAGDRFLRFPESDLWELTALAQHYGLGTRLLDWAESPYVAAYFAASTALRRASMNRSQQTPPPIEIWCAHSGLLTDCRGYANTAGTQTITEVELVETPRFGNARQSAQRGLFTVCFLNSRTFVPHANHYSIELCVRSALLADKRMQEAHQQRPFLFRYRIPFEQARPLLRLLARIGIDGSIVDPTYSGVVAALEEDDW